MLYNKAFFFRIFIAALLCFTIFTACREVDTRILKMSGHRGACLLAPENTMASVDTCIKYGVDFIECDVCISKDSVFYLLHDSLLNGTTNGSGNIADHLSVDIDTLDAGSWFSADFKGQRVPRLVDVLRRVRDNSEIHVTIDYRSGGVEQLVALVKQEGMLDRCTFTFSAEADALELRRLLPHKKVLQDYIRTESDFERVVSGTRPDVAVVWLDSISKEFVAKCHAAGLKVLALAMDGERNNDEDYKKSVELGVDILGTNEPVYFIQKYRE